MKNLIVGLFLCLSQFCFSQGWRTINQPDFNVKYKLPTSWEVDGFGSGFGYWDEGGSSVCDCAGTINFGYDRRLGMVLYPYTNATAENNVMSKRDYVWNYHFMFKEAKEADDYVTKKLTFKKSISKWELLNGGSDEYMGMLDDEVWHYIVYGKDYGLSIYFWGDIDLIRENETTINKILDSMVMIKK